MKDTKRVFSLDRSFGLAATASFGAGAVSRHCAQLVWRELYDMRDLQQKATFGLLATAGAVGAGAIHVLSAQLL